MAINDHKITPANWDGPKGTGWVQDQSGQGKRTHAQHRAAFQPPPLPVVESPLQGDRAQQFVQGYLTAEQARHHRHHPALVGAVAGAVIGKALLDRYMKRR